MDAIERGAAYLAARPRTASQVTEYLLQKGYNKDEVRSAVESLKEYHYIDDEEFARMYIKYAADKGRGLQRIRRELRSKGVTEDTIEDVLYEMEDENLLPDEMGIALQIAADVLGDTDPEALDYKERNKLRGRVSRRLVSRGFSNDTVYSVLQKLL